MVHHFTNGMQDDPLKNPAKSSQPLTVQAIMRRAEQVKKAYHHAHPELTCPCCGLHNVQGFMQGTSLQVHCMNTACGLEGVTLDVGAWLALTPDEITAYSVTTTRIRARRGGV